MSGSIIDLLIRIIDGKRMLSPQGHSGRPHLTTHTTTPPTPHRHQQIGEIHAERNHLLRVEIEDLQDGTPQEISRLPHLPSP